MSDDKVRRRAKVVDRVHVSGAVRVAAIDREAETIAGMGCQLAL